MTNEQVKAQVSKINAETEKRWEAARSGARAILKERGLKVVDAPLMFMAERDGLMDSRLMAVREEQRRFRLSGFDVKMNMQDFTLILY